MDPALPSGSVGGSGPAVRGGIVFRRELFERLGRAARVTQVSAPPGSGKTFLLRSWIGAAGLAERAAWVPVQREERDPQQFWIAVADALRDTATGSALERVNGELAGLLTGEPGGEGSCRIWRRRARSWSRWTRSGPGSATIACSRTCCGSSCGAARPASFPPLHDAAARCFAEHGYPVEGIRHAQAAGNWSAEPALWAEGQPAEGALVAYARAGLELARGPSRGGARCAASRPAADRDAGHTAHPRAADASAPPDAPNRYSPSWTPASTKAARSACCGTCRPACPCRRSPGSCRCR